MFDYKGKSLADFGDEPKKEAKVEVEVEPEAPDMLEHLAEKAMGNPKALVKLIQLVVKSCME